MSAIDIYRKYNLHSAASYIGEKSGYAKKAGENVRGKCPGEMSYNLQGGPKKRIPSFIFGIISVIQHRF